MIHCHVDNCMFVIHITPTLEFITIEQIAKVIEKRTGRSLTNRPGYYEKSILPRTFKIAVDQNKIIEIIFLLASEKPKWDFEEMCLPTFDNTDLGKLKNLVSAVKKPHLPKNKLQ